jgi:hypothetical protein
MGNNSQGSVFIDMQSKSDDGGVDWGNPERDFLGGVSRGRHARKNARLRSGVRAVVVCRERELEVSMRKRRRQDFVFVGYACFSCSVSYSLIPPAFTSWRHIHAFGVLSC